MNQRKRLLALIALVLVSFFILNPLNVLANDDSGLPSLKVVVKELSDRLNSALGQIESNSDLVISLQEQMSYQKKQNDQLQKQVEVLSNTIEELINQKPTSSLPSTTPVTISIASFSGIGYEGQSFPMENLKNKTIIITNAANESMTYTVKTDDEGKANITLPAGLYFFDFNPYTGKKGMQPFWITEKVTNSKIALVSFYNETFNVVTNIYNGLEFGPWSSYYDDGNYLSRF